MGVEAEISRVGGPLQATDLLTGGQGPSSVHDTAVIYGHLLPPGPGARTKELKRRTVSSALAVVGGCSTAPGPVCTCKSRNRSMSTTVVPIVTTRDFPLGDLRTERGDRLNAARLRYRVIGDVDAAREHGWILVFHALTGSADVPDWWGPLVGPGRAPQYDAARDSVDQPARRMLRLDLAYSLAGQPWRRLSPAVVASTLRRRLTCRCWRTWGSGRHVALATGGSLAEW